MGTTSLCPYKGQNETAGSVDLLLRLVPSYLDLNRFPPELHNALHSCLENPYHSSHSYSLVNVNPNHSQDGFSVSLCVKWLFL